MPATLADNLLAWYDRSARDLPWRNPPGEPRPADAAWPYRVWLSEIMLQQTTVASVKPYFAKFLEIWPDVEALAKADEDAVMAAWAGLGYYSRARNLHRCAKQIAQMGGFPETESELRKLPGIGAYSAASIASIAFGKRAVVIDANVERVVARLGNIEEPLPAARRAIRERADVITPDARAGDFAQAMMDLGAQICTSKAPRCLLCPIAQHCVARAAGDPARLPIKPAKKAKPVRQGHAFIIERHRADGVQLWLVTRPATGMLGNMRAFPSDGWSAQADGSGRYPFPGNWRELGVVKHTFTHAQLHLKVAAINHEGDFTDAGEWWDIEAIEKAGLPTLFAKALQLYKAAGS